MLVPKTLPHPGPVALIVNEDDAALDATVDHHRKIGFQNIVVAGGGSVPADVIGIQLDPATTVPDLVNAVMPHWAGRWIYLGYNAEFLYFPFAEARLVTDLVQFMAEEKRDAVFGVTVDLYPGDLDRARDGIALDDAHFDRSGYFSQTRYQDGQALERQVDVFGGLKWRYAEHVPWQRQRIDRTTLFRAREGLTMSPAFLFDDPEMNTISCPWHHNLTAAVASFRVAKSLLTNPGSTFEVTDLTWAQSGAFEWSAQQLVDAGFMEPGQWF